MSRELGNIAESVGAEFLKKLGYRIVATNYYARVGEIDIITTRKDTWHFVEVKYRKNSAHGQAVDFIDKRKLLKIIKTAKRYLYDMNLGDVDWQIDALVFDENLQNANLIENVYCEGLD